MVRISKASKHSDEDETLVTPIVPKVKKVRAVKSLVEEVVTLNVTESTMVAPLVDDDDDVVVDAAIVGEALDSIPVKMSDFSSKLQQMITMLSATKAAYKILEKAMLREFKINQKASSKKSKRSGNHRPSGFVRPTLITDDLATFLGKDNGTKMARTEVSKAIHQYIITNNLQDTANGRYIIADDKLKTLLNLTDDSELTYFNLQRYLKHHFVKVAPSVEDEVVV